MKKIALIAMVIGRAALANVDGDCLPEYAECQGKKGYVTNVNDWSYKPLAWKLVQVFNGYAMFAFEGHAKFRVAVNAKTLSEYAQTNARPGWSLTRALGSDPCLMFDQEISMKTADGFPVQVRAYWAGECPKELQK